MRCSAMNGKGDCIFGCKKIIYTHRCCLNCALAAECKWCSKVNVSYAEADREVEDGKGAEDVPYTDKG